MTDKSDRVEKSVDERRAPVPVLARKAAAADSHSGELKKRAGNLGIQRVVTAQVQAKLSLSTPGDAHEQEADRVSDAVMRMPSAGASALNVQRQCADCEEEQKHKSAPPVSRKEQSAVAPTVTPSIAANINALRGGGSALPDASRAFFEPRFGADFGGVRIHTDARADEAARSIDAKAFTVGNDIAFRSGQYTPGSHEGQKLLAHELTHVVQQSGAVQRKKDGEAAGSPTARPNCHDDRLTKEQFLAGLRWLEEQGHITTEQAISLRGSIPESRRDRCKLIEALARRADAARKSPTAHSKKAAKALINNFEVTPRVIRVDEHEAARITFDVFADNIASVSCMIVKYEFSSERPDYRNFPFRANPGHKVALWDGTFEGSRNQPAEPGTYRVRISVTDDAGNHEEVWEQIRVENPHGNTVLPRTASGLSLSKLEFNGKEAVLTDSGGKQIKAKAVSGLRANNPHNNPEHKDYTDGKYQCEPFKGPIPKGKYFIDGNSAQQPELVKDRMKYPTGSRETGWGPFRVPLRPADAAAVCGRSEFFFHLDVKDDGTAGCIGIASSEEGKFNQMYSLINRIPKGSTLEVTVTY
jgi:hypothetical protein